MQRAISKGEVQAPSVDLWGKLIWILSVAWISASYIFNNESYGAFILLGITALMLLCHIAQNKGMIQLVNNRMYWYMVAFAVYCVFNAVWSRTPGESIQQAITVLEILICIVVFFICYQNDTNVWRLVNALKWSGFIVAIYTFVYYGMDEIQNILAASSRLDNDYANINMIGMLTALAVVLAVYELLYVQKSPLSWVMCIPCVVIIAASGSRKALAMMLLGVIAVLLLRYSSKSLFKNLLVYGIIAIAAFYLIRLLLSLEIFTGLEERLEGMFASVSGEGEVDYSTKLRNQFIRIGMNQFPKTPIGGIGMGASGVFLQQTCGINTYMHNNYVELLCCGGIAAFIIYYFMYVYCAKTLLRFRLRDPLSKLCLVLIVINLVMDYGMVSYTLKITYIYFLILFLHSKHLLQNAAQKNAKEVKSGQWVRSKR